MPLQPRWLYDERTAAGLDFTDPAEVERYEAGQPPPEEVEKEAERILGLLGAGEGSAVLDMGAGTGSFAIAAAKRCARVYAVDVSRAMLERAREKAARAGVENVEFHHGGFLTYAHGSEPLDAVVSKAALHHLPDFWKQVALNRLSGMLRPGGRLYLSDAVYSFDPHDYERVFNEMFPKPSGPDGTNAAPDFMVAVREEFVTMDWILEEMLRRAGFAIDEANHPNASWGSYACTRGRGT
ncbi:MAG TPA: class I SAM-dependent methyltransferase [Sumerlaeia bacterium]|nr:class I SAM-dependent methyltransferase [Sumerlaeia bacterium]